MKSHTKKLRNPSQREGREKRERYDKTSESRKKTCKTRTYLFSLAVLSINRSTLHLFLGVHQSKAWTQWTLCTHVCVSFYTIDSISFTFMLYGREKLPIFLFLSFLLFLLFSLPRPYQDKPSLNIPYNLFFCVSSQFLVITNKRKTNNFQAKCKLFKRMECNKMFGNFNYIWTEKF